MATHGSVGKFEPGTVDWSTYIEQLQYYFSANGVEAEDKKRSILLANCGPATYKLIRSLLPAASVSTTPYNDLVKLVKDYYEPKPSAIVQRFKFNTRSRNSGETIATYVAALRELAEHCSYGDTLSEMLRDRLVCGVQHEGIQRKLLSEKDLTYDKAYTLAQAIEAAERDSKNLKTMDKSSLILPGKQVLYQQAKAHFDKSPAPSQRRNITCYRCGGPHLAPACTLKYEDVECSYCKKKGHLVKVCKAKAQQQRSHQHAPQAQRNYKPSHYVDAEEQDDAAYGLYAIHDDHNYKPITVEVALNNVPVTMEVDTGASVSVISHPTYLKIQEQVQVAPLQPSSVKLKSYTGDAIPVLGTAALQARYNTQQVDVVVQVVSGDGPNLLGRDWFWRLTSIPFN